jgi:hypothetical protein
VNAQADTATCLALTELRGLYEPAAVALASYFAFQLPDVWPDDERPDNWRTSAWARPAAPLSALGSPPADDHFT